MSYYMHISSVKRTLVGTHYTSYNKSVSIHNTYIYTLMLSTYRGCLLLDITLVDSNDTYDSS
jgi:hypothetical protein